jgi:hypothetical protein
MTKRIALTLAAVVAASAACGGSNNTGTNAAANAAPGNANVIKLDPANMPPGLSGSPVPIANVPGISANGAQALPKGATPTPGIPGPDQIKKGLKPGTTPTPGIPDPATIRKQMGLPPLNINAVPPANSAPVPKGRRPTGGKPQ